MGYKNKSPIKQVWLPLDYDFISSHADTFFEFAKAYIKEYGIDLHDIFELRIVGNERIGIALKVDCVSSYCIGNSYNENFTKYAKYDAIERYDTIDNTESSQILISIMTGDNVYLGFGFSINGNGQGINTTLDDLVVELHEI